MAKILGGDKLTAALAAIAAKVNKAASVQVGFLENSTYPDGTSVPMVAAIQEFGSGKVPSRPFFRDMIAAKSGEWPDATAMALKASDYDGAKALALVGEGIKGQLQTSITTFSGVPLSPRTVEAKGNDKQLVDTGHMLASVGVAVKS